MAGHLFCYMLSIGIVITSIGYVEFVRPALREYFGQRATDEQPKEHITK